MNFKFRILTISFSLFSNTLALCDDNLISNNSDIYIRLTPELAQKLNLDYAETIKKIETDKNFGSNNNDVNFIDQLNKQGRVTHIEAREGTSTDGWSK